VAQDNRLFINAVLWILRTGAPWRDLPPDYGDWKNTHRRFCRWRDKGSWEKLLEILIEEPDHEWLIIDASHLKVHPHAAGANGGNQDMERTKEGSTASCIWPWMRMVCRSERLLRQLPSRIVHKLPLIAGFAAGRVLADKGYDTHAILQCCDDHGLKVIISPKRDRTVPREYDKKLYKQRHWVENAFLHLKRGRGIATRYAKNSRSFLAAIHIRCIVLWASAS